MIDNELYLEIVQYCQLNDITNIEKEINSMLRKGFSIVKYGSSPFEKMREQQNLPIQDDVSESFYSVILLIIEYYINCIESN